ncbi:hypothetical protein ACLKA7_011179 [Drosophila subpalustris]
MPISITYDCFASWLQCCFDRWCYQIVNAPTHNQTFVHSTYLCVCFTQKKNNYLQRLGFQVAQSVKPVTG